MVVNILLFTWRNSEILKSFGHDERFSTPWFEIGTSSIWSRTTDHHITKFGIVMSG